MKGGLCCALFAAKAIRDAGIRLKGNLLVESVIGEEDGGIGTLATSLRGYRGDGAIVLEPTALKVAPAQAGALSFRITVPGLSAHASVREEGVSAVEKFLPVYEALRRLERQKNGSRKDPLFRRYKLPYALNVGTVRAGVWPSSVAESLVLEGRYGIGIREKVPAARRAFESAVRDAARRDPWLRRHPPRVEWWGGQFEPARIPARHPLIRTVQEAFRDANGARTSLEGMPYGSDMRILVHVARTPTVLFGPGDVRQAHRPDEFVTVQDLTMATRAVAVAAIRFCGIEA
jgi:acetylornithine deacetylase